MLSEAEVKKNVKALKVEFTDGKLLLILPKTKLTVARYLTRQLKLQEDGWKDDMIRDLADRIEAEMKPPEIVWCKTPEDYITMYTCKGWSCMQTGSFGHICGAVAEAMWKKGLWPTMWYHWNPHLQGVYAVKKGVVHARTFVANGKTYGHFYNDSMPCVEAIKAHLAEKGIIGGSGYNVKIEQEFRVPAIELNDSKYCPLPASDDTAKPFHVRFDKATNEFVFGDKGTAVNDMYAYHGWINSEVLK